MCLMPISQSLCVTSTCMHILFRVDACIGHCPCILNLMIFQVGKVSGDNSMLYGNTNTYRTSRHKVLELTIMFAVNKNIHKRPITITGSVNEDKANSTHYHRNGPL